MNTTKINSSQISPSGIRPPLGVAVALLALALSLFFFSPRLWIMVQETPGSTYWDRGLSFVEQCEKPLKSPEVEPALTWRLAPVIVAKTLGLRGTTVFIIPWIGLLLMLWLSARELLRVTQDFRVALLGTSILATTAATLTVTGWWGINDAWYVAALLLVAWHPSTIVLIAAALIGPWVEERFVLAAPLAFWVRTQILNPTRRQFKSATIILAVGLAIYLVTRLSNFPGFPRASSDDLWQYSIRNFTAWLPWTSAGWFAGLRSGWVLVWFGLFGLTLTPNFKNSLIPLLLASGPMLAITILASDTGRAPTMLIPLLWLGMIRLITETPKNITHRILGLILVANFLLPAMHVTHQKIDIINCLPIEIVRWIQQP